MHANTLERAHTHTYHKGTLGVEGICATGINISISQELQQTDVVIAVSLMGTAENRLSNRVRHQEAKYVISL